VRTKLFVVFVLALALGWMASRHSSSGSHSTSGTLRPAPDFSLIDLSGQNRTLSAQRGHVVVLDFWATWCDPCKVEIPHFVDLQNRYGAQGLQVIGVSMDDDEKLVRDFQALYKMNYPVAMGNTKLAEQYGGILGLPITFLIDRQGRIAARHIGETDAAVFESEVRKLLATP
jgi:cytochrome c biogenesis protein CcmG, thiol:disulfide interchange protein DsbE